MTLRLVLPAAVLLAAAPPQAEPLVLGRFSAGDTAGWRVRHFADETRYRIAEIDGATALEAESMSAASSFYLEREIDLAARPVLEWCWRIEAPVAVADERVKPGDDFAARVYVVAPGEGWFDPPYAISYVWAARARVGADWPNPFTSRVRVMAVESGPDHAGAWRSYRRNLRDDFRRLFGREVRSLEGIAVMTDSDNSRQRARAWYGDIVLRGETGGRAGCPHDAPTRLTQ